MARVWSAGTDLIDIVLGTFDWNFGTVAAAVSITGGAGAYRVPLSFGSGDEANFGLDSFNEPYFYCGGVEVFYSSLTIGTSDGWCVLGFTKATGTATPRVHHYRWTNNTWTHANMSGTTPNCAAFTTRLRIGNDNGGSIISGHMAAVMAIDNRVLTDSEMKRLPAGGWDRWCDSKSVLFEFPSGRDAIGTTTAFRDQGPLRLASSTITGTARSAVTDPPGFRFSRLERRR